MEKQLLHVLFEKKADAQPDAIAIKTIDQSITYQELNYLSNALAKNLLSSQVKPGQLVAVVMEKGWEQVAAVLAILKAGAAYLPIDPKESVTRLHHLLELGEVNIVLTQSTYQNQLAWPENLEVVNVSKIKTERCDNITTCNTSEQDLAYVIFTSGSTGEPKGVMINHQNAVNTILDINERFGVTHTDTIFALSSLTFDLSVYDIFGVLAAGGTIFIPYEYQVREPAQWYAIFKNHHITLWNSAPALIDLFMEYLLQKQLTLNVNNLRLVLLSGDWIPLNLPQKIKHVFYQANIISLGGATEGSIWSILYPIMSVDPKWTSIPYGKAMKNQAFYILDEKLQPVKEGKSGELFIGGQGVAQGYWRDNKRTQARFITHSQYGKLYKTGDLGRYLPDGNIEFLGRVDFQVKVSGYRVELNAIEKVLLDLEYVNQAAVLVTKKALNQQLVAYINFDYDYALSHPTLHKQAERELIAHWQQVYNETLSAITCANNKFNTAGWVSSYTNQAISDMQMMEWVDNTVSRIKQLQPNKILEIGCGTGLLLFGLIDIVDHYCATDVSSEAVNLIKSELHNEQLQRVELMACEANQTADISGEYDTVVINSVSQYLPSVEYFLDIIEQAIAKISGKGHVFIGDVRSLTHFAEFQASILLDKSSSKLTYDEFLAEINYRFSEEELIIDHTFFSYLTKVFSRISYAEILLKPGKFNNEMNNFRYDVILYLDYPMQKNQSLLSWKQWNSVLDGCTNVANIREILINDAPSLIAVKNVPNKRTIGLAELLTNAEFAKYKNWQTLMQDTIAREKSAAIDPATFYTMAKEYNYHASVSWSVDDPKNHFDVVLVKKQNQARFLDCLTLLSNRYNNQEFCSDLMQFSNQPLKSYFKKQLISQTKHYLEEELPYYMVPNRFISVDALPLTANGKVDRTLLSQKSSRFTIADEGVIAPQNETQQTLVKIWQGLLGVEDIGINHDFYNLGGSSLLTIQLLIMIQKTFGIDLHLQDFISQKLDIETLANCIDKKIRVSEKVESN